MRRCLLAATQEPRQAAACATPGQHPQLYLLRCCPAVWGHHSALIWLPSPPLLSGRLLREAPALPQPAVCAFLERLAERSPEWCTLALSTARDCLVQRPPSRAPLLQLVLAAAASPTADTRGKAVRLAANRLYPDPGMAPAIEQAAQQRLDAMVVPPPGGEQAEQQQQDGQAAGEQQQADGQGSGGADTSLPAGQPAAGQGPTDMEAAQLCALYCALCTKKHSLLRHLFEVYGTTSGGRAGMAPCWCPVLLGNGVCGWWIWLDCQCHEMCTPAPCCKQFCAGLCPALLHAVHTSGWQRV